MASISNHYVGNWPTAFRNGSAEQAGTPPARNATSPADTPDAPQQSPALRVELSEQARSLLAANRESTRDFSLVAQDARAVLDSQYADARARGTKVTFDLGQPGIPIDLSSLNDRAVAAIALDRQGNFSSDEIEWAKGELVKRSQDRLGPDLFAAQHGDPRGFLKNVIGQYDSMAPEVREALGWTPHMRLAAQATLTEQEDRLGKLDDDKARSFFDILREFARESRRADERDARNAPPAPDDDLTRTPPALTALLPLAPRDAP
ncbi:MAG: hypothetical protein CTY25_05130 [Methylobacterium sp.]|nr:MAG: hypothetical protein CTY25_05130 [Methylobacterium sp.]